MSGKNSKLFTRITALVLAVLMLGGVMFAAIQAFALGPNEASVTIANTGESNANTWVMVVAVIALVVLICVTVLPKLTKKK